VEGSIDAPIEIVTVDEQVPAATPRWTMPPDTVIVTGHEESGEGSDLVPFGALTTNATSFETDQHMIHHTSRAGCLRLTLEGMIPCGGSMQSRQNSDESRQIHIERERESRFFINPSNKLL